MGGVVFTIQKCIVFNSRII